jgi:inner membrane protein involved in colicin E2 resistance
MEKELKDLAKAGTGYIQAKTAEVWMSIGLTVVLLALMGILYGTLRAFLK